MHGVIQTQVVWMNGWKRQRETTWVIQQVPLSVTLGSCYKFPGSFALFVQLSKQLCQELVKGFLGRLLVVFLMVYQAIIKNKTSHKSHSRSADHRS